MKKTKTAFFCKNCGTESPKWIGKCNSCGEWNSYVEEILPEKASKATHKTLYTESKPFKIAEIPENTQQRMATNDEELNRVMGGGIVQGSIILLGGEPGIGKSTLALQTVLRMNAIESVYISGEESMQQVKMRAKRICADKNNCWVINETSLEKILNHLEQINPGIVIIDSIQTIHSTVVESSPGSISQISECTGQLLKYSKINSIPVILIGHITKDGNIAGPKALEHIVDVVLQMEGDSNQFYRVLRAIKNRYGSTSEIGIYEMKDNGLYEIKNPSEMLLPQRDRDGLTGIAIAASIEGIRPFMIEVQSLVGSAVYSTPQRSTTGFYIKRLNMLLAVLEKRVGIKLAHKDVFLNIAGGIYVSDPSIDLAVLSAIISSSLDIGISHKTCFSGEVGLSGEIRPGLRMKERINEASRTGFKKIFIPKMKEKIQPAKGIEVIQVAKISEVFKMLFS